MNNNVHEIFEARVDAATDNSKKERMAMCVNCGRTRKSSERDRLAFFKEEPNAPYDSFYCGCYGWD